MARTMLNRFLVIIFVSLFNVIADASIPCQVSEELVMAANINDSSQSINIHPSSYSPCYLAISGIAQHAVGFALMSLGAANFLKGGGTTSDFHTQMFEIDLGILLQATSPIFSCIGESKNRRILELGTVKKRRHIPLSWGLYAASGILSWTFPIFLDDYHNKSLFAIGIASATLVEACWITCHWLSVSSINKVYRKNRIALSNYRIHPILINRSSIGIGFSCSVGK